MTSTEARVPPPSPTTGTTNPVRGIRALFADFVIALLLFSACLGGYSSDRGHAFPAPPPAELTAQHAARAIDRATATEAGIPVAYPAFQPFEEPRSTDLQLLAVALATLAAFNLAVWRHLRRAYASPRRSPWRRGA
jgi:hypothetical protein